MSVLYSSRWWWMCRQPWCVFLSFFAAMRRKMHNIQCNVHQQCLLFLSISYKNNKHWQQRDPKFITNFKRPLTLEYAIASEKLCIHIFVVRVDEHDESIDARNDPFEYLSWMPIADSSKVICQWRLKVREFFSLFFFSFISIQVHRCVCLLRFMRQSIWLTAMHQMGDKRLAKSVEWFYVRQSIPLRMH